MKMKPAAILMLLSLSAAMAWSQSSENQTALRNELIESVPSLSMRDVVTLLREGEIARPFDREDDVPSLTLAPAYQAEIASRVRELEPTIGVEVLFLLEAPTAVTEIDARLFEIMNRISTMEGIEYFSASRNRMRTFFHESYVVDNPESRTRIADPTFSTVPSSSQIHVFQRDSSFGSNVYRLDYLTSEDSLWLAMENLTQMFYQGILPALGPELLQLHLVVRPVGDHLLFYGTSAARPGFLFGMEGRVQDSFYNRLVALNDWFIGQMDSD